MNGVDNEKDSGVREFVDCLCSRARRWISDGVSTSHQEDFNVQEGEENRLGAGDLSCTTGDILHDDAEGIGHRSTTATVVCRKNVTAVP